MRRELGTDGDIGPGLQEKIVNLSAGSGFHTIGGWAGAYGAA